jgi:hypothetical protein
LRPPPLLLRGGLGPDCAVEELGAAVRVRLGRWEQQTESLINNEGEITLTDVTARPRVWLDCETTSLGLNRRAWEIAFITRQPHQRDQEWQFFIHPADLDLPNADPESLKFGRFYERHPHGQFLADGGSPYDAPKLPGVYWLQEILSVVARETAGATICGSNPSFDTYTLEARNLEYGVAFTWHYHPEDTPTLARGWLLGRGLDAPRKSDDIARACGVDPDRYGRHSALGDCRLFRDLSDVIEPKGSH